MFNQDTAGNADDNASPLVAHAISDGKQAPHSGWCKIDSLLIPGGILVILNIAIFSATASNFIRPDMGRRMPMLFIAYSLGLFLGGFFPHSVRWMRAAVSMPDIIVRRILLTGIIMAGLASLLPGLHAYIFDKSLRLFSVMCLGLLQGMSYTVFFSRFPIRHQGTWFGLCTGLGLLLWNFLFHLSGFFPQGEMPFHPFLSTIYGIHILAVGLVCAIGIWALVLKPDPSVGMPSVGEMRTDQPGGRRSIKFLFAANCLGLFLCGITGATHTRFALFQEASGPFIVSAMLWSCYAPAAGWLYDNYPKRVFRTVLPLCCCFYTLMPAYSVVGQNETLHDVLLQFANAAQFSLITVSSVALVRLSPKHGVLYVCCLHAMRGATALGIVARNVLIREGAGPILIIGIVLAFILCSLLRKVHIDSDKKPAPAQPDLTRRTEADGLPSTDETSVAAIPADAVPSDKVEAFLALRGLTPREREVGGMLLRGDSVVAIAFSLEVSERTVKKHTANLYKKFSVSNRHEFYRLFVESAVLTPALPPHESAAFGEP